MERARNTPQAGDLTLETKRVIIPTVNLIQQSSNANFHKAQALIPPSGRENHPGPYRTAKTMQIKKACRDRELLNYDWEHRARAPIRKGSKLLSLVYNAPWCNGNTTVFGTVILGSSPGGAARMWCLRHHNHTTRGSG